MLYCINPKCPQRQIADTAIECPACKTTLLVHHRYLLVRPLRTLDRMHPYAEIFEVQDIKDDGKLKVLKVIKNDYPQLVRLFQQEASLLVDMTHPGIPKGEEQFSLEVSNGDELHCLVMERIAGQNLEQWLEQNGRISQEQALKWLQQIIEILDYVHKNGLFHRDIKPSNIMLRTPTPSLPPLSKGGTREVELILIDFGTARRVTQTVIDGRDITVVYSDGYTAPEQIDGRAVPQSDFFSLGRTFVHLLTGKHPNDIPRDPQTGRLVWCSNELQISGSLVDLINQLMALSWQNRPRDTQMILQRLREIKQPDYGWFLLKLTGVGAAILIALVIYWYLTGVGGCSKIWLRRFPISGNLSCGQEILVPGIGIALQNEQQGVNAFAAGNYGQAVDFLEKAWQQRRDPETLIYLNNARLMPQKAYAIAVVAPITISNNRDIALEILRGVAMAQNEINQGKKINGIGLKVLIADDANNPTQARQIASELVSKEDILAVVGHFSSQVTLAVADIYKQNQLVMISPSSTSEDLAIFRTVCSDSVTSEALAKYLINLSPQQKVAVFYNSQNKYSSSLYKEFGISLKKHGGQVIKEKLDLSDPLFNPDSAINQAKQQGATALALLPESQTNSNSFNNALKVIHANRGHYRIVGGDSLYNHDTLERRGLDALNRLVVAIPWHSMSSPNQEFTKTAKKLWGGEVSWRTALAYDATRTLIAALEKQPPPKRSDLQQVLADPNFEAKGATGVIHFNKKGDRRECNIQLVRVSQSKEPGDQVFVPLK